MQKSALGARDIMIQKTSPLGRESMHFRDKMLKYHAEIEHMVYAAEILCSEHSDNKYHCSLGKKCPFKDPHDHLMSCRIDSFRLILGDHFSWCW